MSSHSASSGATRHRREASRELSFACACIRLCLRLISDAHMHTHTCPDSKRARARALVEAAGTRRAHSTWQHASNCVERAQSTCALEGSESGSPSPSATASASQHLASAVLHIRRQALDGRKSAERLGPTSVNFKINR